MSKDYIFKLSEYFWNYVNYILILYVCQQNWQVIQRFVKFKHTEETAYANGCLNRFDSSLNLPVRDDND